jgi:hypothetical protein
MFPRHWIDWFLFLVYLLLNLHNTRYPYTHLHTTNLQVDTHTHTHTQYHECNRHLQADYCKWKPTWIQFFMSAYNKSYFSYLKLNMIFHPTIIKILFLSIQKIW